VVRRMTAPERPSSVLRVQVAARRSPGVDRPCLMMEAVRHSPTAEEAHRIPVAAGRPSAEHPSAERPSVDHPLADHRNHLAAVVPRNRHLEVQAGARRSRAAVRPSPAALPSAVRPSAVRVADRNHQAVVRAALRIQPEGRSVAALRIQEVARQVGGLRIRRAAVVVLRIRPQVEVLRIRVRVVAVARRLRVVARQEDPAAVACRPWRSWSFRLRLAQRPRGSP
jgi:hypothetical protein